MINWLRRPLMSWEGLLAIVTLVVIAAGALITPAFLSAFNLSQLAAGMAEKALIALPMMLLILTREIDLSVASTLGFCSVIFGMAISAGLPVGVAVAATLVLGAVLGAVNGILVAGLGLPSLIVTLGTMSLYRGLGFVVYGSGSVNVFPDLVADFGYGSIPGTAVPWVVLPFLLLVPVFLVVLNITATGRRLYAIGGNPEVARYSGVRVDRLRFWLFVLAGFCSAMAAIIYTARLSNARANNGLMMELDVITIVFLGGISVFGGKGRLMGVLWAIVLIAAIRNLLSLNAYSGDAQGTVIGLLLIGSTLASNFATYAFGRYQLWMAVRAGQKGQAAP